jgi:hypothetical protein
LFSDEVVVKELRILPDCPVHFSFSGFRRDLWGKAARFCLRGVGGKLDLDFVSDDADWVRFDL